MNSKTSKALFAIAISGVLSFGGFMTVKALPGGGGGTVTADFNASTECEGNQTSFSSTSTTTSGSLVEWNWDFDNDGDFTDASGASAGYTFPGWGTFTVGHQAINDGGDTSEVYKNVTVHPVAVPDFNATEVCAGNSTSLVDNSSLANGSIVSYAWDLDNDGFFDDATGPSNTYNFGPAGTYTVGLRVTTDQGCISNTYQSVTVNPNPTVDFTYTDVCIGDTTQFMGMGNVASGSIVSYAWDLDDDGVFAEASGQNISHLFTTTGTQEVGLQVTTDNGCTATIIKVVTISPLPVVQLDGEDVCEGETISFSNTSINQVGTISYEWDFGDGNTSTEVEPEHTYSGAGTYTVDLLGTNSYGCADSASISIKVNPKPTAEFTWTDVCFGEETNFTNASTGNGAAIETYFWDFDDGNGSTVLNPNHTYGAPGTYNVTLMTTNIYGCMDTVSHGVNVWELPEVIIQNSGDWAFCDGESVELSVPAEGGSTAFWSTGENTSTITVDEKGTYSVVVTDGNGCQGRDTVEIIVWELPTLSISNDTSVSLGEDVPLWVDGADTYVWSPSTYLDNSTIAYPNSEPLSDITYSVLGTDMNGCQNTTSVSIEVEKDYVFFPTNAITPNGNGQNDTWFVENLQYYYDDCRVDIYDRLGNNVFYTRSYANEWDGTYEGNTLPEGTYYYTIRCHGTDKVYKGPITLLRLDE